mmetsp:Transcript_116899/g.162419  ORF Transcript_116899/g.162419 Transcript_116899/m.162419 type:complete len:313 (+) Transcript_116899:1009-1947(+)
MELILAVLDLSVRGSLDIEKSLQVVESFSLSFEIAGLLVVFINNKVSFVDNFRVSLNNVVRQSLHEFKTELSELQLEFLQVFLNVSSLLLLLREDGFFYVTKSSLRNIIKGGLAVLKNDKVVIVSLHLANLVLLEEHDGLLHRVNSLKGLILDDADISQVSHYLHEEVLLFLGLGASGQHLNTLGNISDEFLDVRDLGNSVVKQEADVHINPVVNSLLQLGDKRSRVNTDPADLDRGLDLSDLVLDLGQVGDLLIELVKAGELGMNTLKDLLFQASVGFFLLFSKVLIIFSSFEFLDDKVLKLNTSIKESLE